MIYKQYGKLPFQVSAVGFGGMQFDIKNNSDDQNAELLSYAYDKGITYFDTAPNYCDDRSEIIFGKALPKLPRDKIYVSTKQHPHLCQNFADTEATVKKSLHRLNCDYLDFFHVWCLRNLDIYETAMKPGAEYESLLKLQEQGLIRHIVFSSHQPGSEIKQIIEDPRNNFAGVLLGANILNFPYRWDGVEAAYRAGVAVAAMNPLAGGTIPRHEKDLAFLATDGYSPVESALRFLICCPQITITLNGFTTREHIDTACRIADTAKSFTAEEIETLRKKIGKELNAICTGCGYCLKGCPQNITIPAFMLVYNEKQMLGKTDEEMRGAVKGNYGWGTLVGREGQAESCVACGACETACTQHLPIIERLKKIAEWSQA